MKKLGLLLVALSLAACSNKAMYQNMQSIKKQECDNLPPSEYDECIGSLSKSYEEYQEDREDVLSD